MFFWKNINGHFCNVIIIDSTKTKWCFKINFKKLIIEKFKNFAKNLKNEQIVFVLICVDVVTQTQFDFKIFEVFEQIKNFESQFDDKKIEILFENMNNFHAIDLIKNQQFFLWFCTICLKKNWRNCDDIWKMF